MTGRWGSRSQPTRRPLKDQLADTLSTGGSRQATRPLQFTQRPRILLRSGPQPRPSQTPSTPTTNRTRGNTPCSAPSLPDLHTPSRRCWATPTQTTPQVGADGGGLYVELPERPRNLTDVPRNRGTAGVDNCLVGEQLGPGIEVVEPEFLKRLAHQVARYGPALDDGVGDLCACRKDYAAATFQQPLCFQEQV